MHARSERVVSLAARDLTTLGGAVLADDPTSSPLRHLEAVLQHDDRTPPRDGLRSFPWRSP